MEGEQFILILLSQILWKLIESCSCSIKRCIKRCVNYNPSISFTVGRWYGITVVIYHTSKQQAQKSIPARELIVQTKMLLLFAMFAPSFQAQQCIASFSLLTLQQTAYLPISCYTRLEVVIVISFFKCNR